MNEQYKEFLNSSGIGQPQTQEDYKAIIVEFGPPGFENEKGNLSTLNEIFWAAYYARQRKKIIYEPDEKRFYDYDPATGIFVPKSPDAIRVELNAQIMEGSNWPGYHGLDHLRTERNIRGVLAHLRGHVEERDFFVSSHPLVHLGNCTLKLDPESGEFIREDFSADHHSRNRSPISYNPKAKCREFEQRMLAHIGEDDRHLLQKYAGQCLLGRNLTQRFLILDGIGGSSKTSFIKVIVGIIGPKNVYELRTKQLAERFEIGRMIGKTLLTGSDVQSYFLTEPGAYRIKTLIGGDLLEAELKCSNDRFEIYGTFNILISSNTRLHLSLQGDRSAWARRLTIVRYDKAYEGQRIFNVDEYLLGKEAPGILNWCLKGLEMLFQDYRAAGDIILSEVQKKRVEDLLSESDSLGFFVRDMVILDTTTFSSNGNGKSKEEHYSVTAEELTGRYIAYCREKGWTPLPMAITKKQLPDLMLRQFGITQAHNIEREGKHRRGFWNVRLLPGVADWL